MTETPEKSSRCDAATTITKIKYVCQLDDGHEGSHADNRKPRGAMWINDRKTIHEVPPLPIVEAAESVFRRMDGWPLADKVNAINAIRVALAAHSPFATEPVDCVQWVPAHMVAANDYNPNAVAPPEMELLRLSIMADGYTQPIVANMEGTGYEVIDGFHRNRVGRECEDVQARVHGYLPVVQIRGDQTDRPDRIASTVRHNRARGRHSVEGMSSIVLELKRRNWSDDKIGRQLGMDPDEVLRLAQITGLAEAFKDRDFSEAWEAVLDDVADDDLLDSVDV